MTQAATWPDDPAATLELIRAVYRDDEINERGRVQLTAFYLWPYGLPDDVQDALSMYWAGAGQHEGEVSS